MAGPIGALECLPLFQSLSAQDRCYLAENCAELPLARGEVIYRAGDPSDGYFLVQAGTVLLFATAISQGRELLGRLRPGDTFGECGLFEGHDRSETAQAEELGTVLKLERQALLAVLDNHPLVALKLRLAAARGHSARVETGLAIAKRQAPRFYVNQDVTLSASDAGSRPATMVDLSRLGTRIQHAPGSWKQNDQVHVAMSWESSTLRRRGRVAWCRQDLVGIEFRSPSESDQDEVQQILGRLLKRTRGSSSGNGS